MLPSQGPCPQSLEDHRCNNSIKFCKNVMGGFTCSTRRVAMWSEVNNSSALEIVSSQSLLCLIEVCSLQCRCQGQSALVCGVAPLCQAAGSHAGYRVLPCYNTCQW